MSPTALLIVSLATLAAAGSPMADCSDNGVYYTDINACQCYQCFTGPHCESFNDTCTISAASASPVMEQEFWSTLPAAVEEEATACEAAYYRTPYQRAQPETVGMALPNSTAGIAAPLVQEIVKLHTSVGNVRLSPDQTVVFGSGCTPLIAAVEYAFQRTHGGQVTVFSQRPAYESYAHQSAFLRNTTFTYAEDLRGDSPILEFVCVPNNPTGAISTPVYNNSFVVYDTVYNWPGAAPMTPDIDADVVLFSLSKLTGHAGTRFGWAFVKDPEFAALMNEFIDLVEVHTSIDGQRRALSILKTFNSGTVMTDFFNATANELTTRFQQLDDALFSKAGYERASAPGLPYAWVHCTQTQDCQGVFNSVGIATRPGSFYGGTDDYLRLVVVQSAAVWKQLLLRLAKLP